MASSNTKRDEKQSSNDLYTTPIEALDAIWPYLITKDIDCSDNVLEPCAGMGDISKYLAQKGICVETNELYPVNCCAYDYTDDFLAEDNGIGMYDLIITNPPYNNASEFILKGFEHAPIGGSDL